MWIKDPKDGKKSVSLTGLVISFVLVTVLIVLNAFEKIKTVSNALELFGLCVGLYFSRKNISIGKKTVDLGEEKENK